MKKLIFILVNFLFLISVVSCGGGEQRANERIDKAQVYFDKNEIEKARVELKNALQIEPKNTRALYMLGKIYEKKKLFTKAVQHYQQVIDLDPNHFQAVRDIGLIYLIAGQMDKAKEYAAQGMEIAPNDPSVLTFNGTLKWQLKNIKDAENLANRALKSDKNFIDASMLLASVYSQTNRYTKAVEIIQAAISNNKEHIGLLKVLAKYYDNEGKSSDAITLLERVINIQPNNFIHRDFLASYLIKLNDIDSADKVLETATLDLPDNKEAKLAYVRFLHTYGENDEAMVALSQYIEQNPDQYDFQFAMAEVEISKNNYTKAQSIYRNVIENDRLGPAGISARNKLAIVLIKEEKIEQALTYIAEVIKENPQDTVALGLRGNIELSRKNATHAISDYRAVLRQAPNSVDIMKKLAAAHSLNNEVKLAIDTLKKAIEINSKDIALHFQLGQLAVRQMDYKQAIKSMQNALALREDYQPALESLFKAQLALKQTDQATETIKTILKLYPNEAIGNYFSALLYQDQGQVNKSIEAYKSALIKDPKAIEPLSGLVKLYIKQNEHKAAIKQLDKVLKLHPENVVVQNIKGEVLLSQKRYKHAEKIFANAIKTNPKYVFPYVNLAQIRWEINQNIDDVIKIYKKGISETKYNAPRLVYNLASLYERIGQHDDAIELYKVLIEKDSQALRAANNMAMLLVSQKSDAKSYAQAKDLIQMLKSSENPVYLDTMGWVYYHNNEIDMAISMLKRADDKLPNQPVLQYHLGMAYFSSGNKHMAVEKLKSALASEYDFEGKAEAEQALKMINT